MSNAGLSASFSPGEATSCVAAALLKKCHAVVNSCLRKPTAFQQDPERARRRLRPAGARFVGGRMASGDPIKPSQEGKLVKELECHKSSSEKGETFNQRAITHLRPLNSNFDIRRSIRCRRPLKADDQNQHRESNSQPPFFHGTSCGDAVSDEAPLDVFFFFF